RTRGLGDQPATGLPEDRCAPAVRDQPARFGDDSDLLPTEPDRGFRVQDDGAGGHPGSVIAKLPAAAAAAGSAAAAPAVAATGPAAAAAATAKAAAPAAATAGTGTLGLFDLDGPAVEAGPVELVDRLIGFFIRRHLDESEAARAAGVAIRHHARGLDVAACGERLAQTLGRCGEGEASDEEFDSHGERSLWPSDCVAIPGLGRRTGTRPETAGGGSRRTGDRTRRVKYTCRDQ